MKRTLTLRRDALADLTPGELAGVHGAMSVSCPLQACIDQMTGDIQERREELKDLLNYTREGCTPAYGGM